MSRCPGCGRYVNLDAEETYGAPINPARPMDFQPVVAFCNDQCFFRYEDSHNLPTDADEWGK